MEKKTKPNTRMLRTENWLNVAVGKNVHLIDE